MCQHTCIPDCDSAFWYSSYGKAVICSCGESQEASATLTSPQHSSFCEVIVAYRKWEKEMAINNNEELNEEKFTSLNPLLG